MSLDTDIKSMVRKNEKAYKFFMKKLAFTLGPAELKNKMMNEDIQIIDVRMAEDFDKSHIPSSISIPKNELEFNLHKLSKDKINVVYCYNQQCHLAARAALILADKGYPVMELEGGFKVWRDDFDYEVVS